MSVLSKLVIKIGPPYAVTYIDISINIPKQVLTVCEEPGWQSFGHQRGRQVKHQRRTRERR